MARKLTLEEEIYWLVRIINTDHDGVRLKATSPSDRDLLKSQIDVRSERLKVLRQQLADQPGIAPRGRATPDPETPHS